jgi:2-polyprenyl-3-methyl-5-hydroxy-6-metoxy-1,4-benzoquinol methylase
VDAPRTARQALGAALARYRAEPLAVRAFVRLRHWLTPLASVLDAVPPEGRILDVGCGHGLAALALALASPRRRVLGIDPDRKKITVAARAAAGVANVELRAGGIEAVGDGDYDAVVILDVLYLLPRDEKLALLRACRARIASGGTLVVKTNDTRPRWKYEVTRAQESLMTAAGLTLGRGELHFLCREDNAALLAEAGFRVEARPLPTWLPYPAVLFAGGPAVPAATARPIISTSPTFT